MARDHGRKTTEGVALTRRENATVIACVKRFVGHLHLFQLAADSLLSACNGDPELKKYIHFTKLRIKDPGHLREKLRERALSEKRAGREPTVSVDNLFESIGDLAGVRILHLHTDQIRKIDERIKAVLAEQKYNLVDGPIAYIWDDESQRYFSKLGIKTEFRETMYSSVHYVVEFSTSSRVRCELQVRTLADELWGEVSHTVDYPNPTKSVACKEQLMVLARVTSGCTRLVDSIFRSQVEFDGYERRRIRRKRKRGASGRQ